MTHYDLAVIGSGWAGFNAAKKARESGLKVALIEKEKVGGTCLNRGCIPTKALIQSAKVYSICKKSGNFGIESSAPKVNLKDIQGRKEAIVLGLRSGMESLLKGVDFIREEARILSNDSIQAGSNKITCANILIATGSSPSELRDLKFDHEKILSSDDILSIDEIPSSLLVVGGGVIGCEFASLFAHLGSKVTIIEKMPQLLPGEDKEAARKLENIFKKRRIKVATSNAAFPDLKEFSRVLVCVGRRPSSEGFGLEDLGVEIENAKICVDEFLRTSIPNIYAAGDCTGKLMLAHYAAYQGEIAAHNIADPNNLKKCDKANIPNCIFTDPEISSVGLKEEEAVSKGIETKISKFDFLGSGMARILDEKEGFIKVVSEKASGRVIGGSIIGPRATELIGILTLAVSAGLSVSSLKETVFAHPTLHESIHEAVK